MFTQRELAAALRESVFSPHKPGPMKIIVDVGNVNYYTRRGCELATLAQTALTAEQASVYLTQAIAILGVAKLIIKKGMDVESHKKLVTLM